MLPLALLGALPGGCSERGPKAADPSGGAGGMAPVEDPEYSNTLRGVSEYAALAAEGSEVKYLTRVDGTVPPRLFAESECLFQNTRKYPYHLLFLRTFEEYSDLSRERYEDLVLRRATRVMWGGTLKLFNATRHPLTGALGVVSFTVYSSAGEGEALLASDVLQLHRRLQACLPFASELLVFTPDGTLQLRRIDPLREELLAHGLAVVEPSMLRSGLLAESYSTGEGYGYLKRVPPGQMLPHVGPRDILVVETAPADLGLVAGVLSREPQSLASHLNLRLREKQIPNASVPDVFENSLIAGLSGRLVRLSVTASSVAIEPAQLEQAEAFWESRRPNVGQPLADLEFLELRAFSELSKADSVAVGVKAANLGELQRVLPAHNRVEGFAIPFRAFADFVSERGLSAQIEALLGDPLLRSDAGYKQARLAQLRRSIRSTELLPNFLEALREAVLSAYGPPGLVTRLRFRSSTNAEDLPGLSGAGLYDSASGCLADDADEDELGPSLCLSAEQERFYQEELARRRVELSENPDRAHLPELIADLEGELHNEKSAARAILRVFSSLWNERAFDDREYYGIDHRLVYMGVAVHPAFVGEQLEAVALTNLEAASAEPLYRVVSQAGEIGVVRPIDPFATPEILSFRRTAEGMPSEVTLVAPSSLSPDGASLWSQPAVSELADLLFRVQDHFASAVYPELVPLVLDVELDVTLGGQIVIKQARPTPP